ncbi:hypothetical protein BAY60_15425 [Prauserella muralis]|uniref:Uncharacterized protein n=1 Tax=Prauserella muralis TaxID=588067 RepID=A0A2V4B2Z3_9PSEU|nr:hypothetical protein BAY60_15425 [Prauserella muralis]
MVVHSQEHQDIDGGVNALVLIRFALGFVCGSVGFVGEFAQYLVDLLWRPVSLRTEDAQKNVSHVGVRLASEEFAENADATRRAVASEDGAECASSGHPNHGVLVCDSGLDPADD